MACLRARAASTYGASSWTLGPLPIGLALGELGHDLGREQLEALTDVIVAILAACLGPRNGGGGDGGYGSARSEMTAQRIVKRPLVLRRAYVRQVDALQLVVVASNSSLARLREIVAIGRRYDQFAQNNPSQAILQIAELNEPGLQENAWDLQWVPSVLRAKIARVSSALVLELCGTPGDPQHDPAMMDVAMRAAILAACIVGHSYGVALDIPTRPLEGHLEVLARLLHRLTRENPEELEILGNAHATPLTSSQLPIAACLPPRVRDRLIGLVQFIAADSEILRPRIGAVVLVVGAVAAETFDSLNIPETAFGLK